MDVPRDEVAFLALHYLHSLRAGPAAAAALASLDEALVAAHLTPAVPALDRYHEPVSLTYEQCVERFAHVPRSYLADVLRERVPLPGASLLGTGRFSTVPGAVTKRPRVPGAWRGVDASRARFGDTARNVAMILDQQMIIDRPMPLEKVTFAVLHKSVRKVKKLVGHYSTVFCVLYDCTSRYIISGSDDHLIKIWSAETGYLVHTLRGHIGDISDIAKHSNGKIIVSASNDGTLRVWDIVSGAALAVLRGSTKEVLAVQLSPCPDRAYLVSGGADGSVLLWNADDFSLGGLKIPLPQRTVAPAHSSGAASAASPVAAENAAVRAAAAAATAARRSTGSSAPSSAGGPPPQPSLVQHQHTWPDTQEPHSTGPPVSVAAVAPLPGAPAPAPRNAAVDSMVSGTPTYEVLSVAFNAGATRLAVGGSDCAVHVFAIEKRDPSLQLPNVRHLTSLRGHSKSVSQVLFSRLGDRMVTACHDGTARIWRRTCARLPTGKRRNKQPVSGMGSWSSIVLDCRSSIEMDLLSIRSGGAGGSACTSTIPRMPRARFPVSVDAVIWTRNDAHVLTASSDTNIRVWDSVTGKLMHVLDGHEGAIYALDTHPLDNRVVLSASYDGKCILWDIEKGVQLRAFSIREESGSTVNIVDAQFAPNGLSFVVSDTSGAITVFGADSGESTALAPEKQFFSNDFAPFRRDAENRAVDEDTGLLLHLMPKGRLCDGDLRPHPPELQANLPPPPPPEPDEEVRLGYGKDGAGGEGLPNERSSTRNRDLLTARAIEFRRNQAAEERRLIREAREARRAALIAKARAELERDTEPAHLALREFQVPDSDPEDPDAEFQGEIDAAMSQSSDESSSSSEEGGPRPGQALRYHDQVSRGSQRRAGHRRRCLRSNVHSSVAADRRAMVDSDDGDCALQGQLESDGYQAESQDDEESDGSSTVGRRRSDEHQRYRKSAKAVVDSRPSSQLGCDGVVPARSGGSNCPSSVAGQARQHEGSQTPRLPGASVAGVDQRRMVIHLNARGSHGASPLQRPPSSFSHLPQGSRGMSHIVDGRPIRLVSRRAIGGANGDTFDDGRDASCGVGSVVPAFSQKNPSFTCDQQARAVPGGGHLGVKTIEEHQGDTASCVGADWFPDSKAGPGNQSDKPVADMAASATRAPAESSELAVQPNQLPPPNHPLQPTRSVGGAGHSLLSDSPARATRHSLRRRHNSERQQEVQLRAFEDDEIAPAVDIDEISRRELEDLDNERFRRRVKKRARRLVTPGSSGSDGVEIPSKSARVVSSHLRGGCDDERMDKACSPGKQSRATRHNFDGDDDRKRRRKKQPRAVEGAAAVINDLPQEQGTLRRAVNVVGAALRETTGHGGEVQPENPITASDWLRASTNRYAYVPQVGDDVMYFPQGHVGAMECSQTLGMDPLMGAQSGKARVGRQFLDGHAFSDEPFRFQISAISYEFPVLTCSARSKSVPGASRPGASARRQKETANTTGAKTVAVLSMVALRRDNGSRVPGSSEAVLLAYYPVDAPEYVVLTSRVMAAVTRMWKPRDRFRILFLNERRAWQYYTGVVCRLKGNARSTMWNSVEVQYDSENDPEKGVSVECVSPWELESLDILTNASRGPPTRSTQLLPASTVEPGLFIMIARELDAIRSLETNWRAQLSWFDTVDALALIPGYCDKIACPFDLNIIMVRLCTGYYRHYVSFLEDLALLKANAVRVGGPGSDMGALANAVHARLVDIAERIRIAFLAMVLPAPAPVSGSVAPAPARILRPRPSPSGDHASLQHLAPHARGRNSQAAMGARPSMSGFAVPYSAYSAGAPELSGAGSPGTAATASYRSLPQQMRSIPPPLGGQFPTGGSLPPVVPGMVLPGQSNRGGGRSTRRGQSGRFYKAPPQRIQPAVAGAGALQSPAPVAAFSTASMQFPVSAMHSASSPHAHHSQVQQMGMMLVPPVPSSAMHTTAAGQMAAGGGGMSRPGASTRSQPHSVTRAGTASRTGIVTANHTPSGPAVTGSGAISPYGLVGRSPQQEVANGPMTGGVRSVGAQGCIIQGGGYTTGAPALQRIGTAGAVDGGAHSWGGSMEGAGGIIPLQASTSDSHLPVPMQLGRSPSPMSRSVRVPSGGAPTPPHPHQHMIGALGATLNNEDSSISVAAAESTMSWGGGDVANNNARTATAESVEFGAHTQ